MPGSPTLPPKLGRYDVVSRVAMGGMAELLLGKLAGPSGFERAVAIKRILPHYAQHPSFVQMFLDEGRLAARIGHPNVVQVHELGQEGEDLYLVMELLQGESAAGVLRRLHARNAQLPPELAVHIVASACAGLHAAHELKDASGKTLGLVHRDVSPQNLFVSYDGTVKVLDFGVAKAADRISQTEQGTIKGKLEYMSPEQARGSSIDRRSDVFSLGAVLHELLTRKRLFRRSNPGATWNAVCADPIPPPSSVVPGVPAALDAVCLRALERDPARRYATALELRRALLDWLHGASPSLLPEEGLAALMAQLFSDRIAGKQSVVASLREGVTPAAVPPGEPDLEVELPSVIDATPPTKAVPPPRPRRAPWLALGGTMLLASAAGVWVALPRPAAEPPPLAAPPSVAEQAAPAPTPAKVSLFIESTPAGATVLLGGVVRGETPLTLELDPSPTATALRLERPGHQPLEEQLVPSVSQRLKYSLTPVKRATPVRARTAAPKAPPPPKPEPEKPPEPEFRRFN